MAVDVHCRNCIEHKNFLLHFSGGNFAKFHNRRDHKSFVRNFSFVETCKKQFSAFLPLSNPVFSAFIRVLLSWPFVFKQLLKLNWMFYVLSPTFFLFLGSEGKAQHRKKESRYVPTCRVARTRAKHTQKIFPILSWCTPTPTHHRPSGSTATTRWNFRLFFCQACELVRRSDCV